MIYINKRKKLITIVLFSIKGFLIIVSTQKR